MRYDSGEHLARQVKVQFPDWALEEGAVPKIGHPTQVAESPVAGDQVSREDWITRAKCRDNPNEFRPSATVTAAQLVCSMCEVKDPCLDYSISHREPIGVWSGLSAARRAKYHKALDDETLTEKQALSAARIERDEQLAKLGDK